jgi:hypothetical protein
LAPLREIADEIVIAAGGPVDEETLRYYCEIADRLFAIEFSFIERHLAWLHAQCSGDWILRLDGDEIPSPGMVAEVANTRDDRGLSCVSFSRRALFPTIDNYIVQEPWYPDFQVRMVRNDGSMRFAGLQHTTAERTLPGHAVEAPLYHLSLLSEIADRRARAARYERLRPGMVAPTRLPANDMYLPETLPPLLAASVPQRDLSHIEAVISAAGPAPACTPDTVPVSLEQMDRLWAGRTLPEMAYRASIELVGTPVPLSPGERRPLYFRVRNEGSECWSWDPSVGPHLHLVHRLLSENGAPLEDWRPAFFTEWVRPSMVTIVPGYLDAPDASGRYELEMKIRHAPERLFGTAQKIEVVVRPEGARLDRGK